MKNEGVFFKIAAAVLLLSFLLSYSCDNGVDDDGLAFGPGKYRGIYIVIDNWKEPSDQWITRVDSMLYHFRSDGIFHMRHDSNYTQDKDLCEVNGEYDRFRQDSIAIDVTYIFPTAICNHDYVPEARYRIIGYGDYLTLESRDSLYRRLELYPF